MLGDTHDARVNSTLDTSAILKRTTSRCTVCGRPAPATAIVESGRVYLDRECPVHGFQRRCISSDVRFYHLSKGSCCSQNDCCNSDSTGPDPFQALSTCLALIEIVDSCNLACPTCFADSPVSRDVECVSLEDFQQRVNDVVRAKRKIEVLQLSGGEPTIHPQFFELLDWCQRNPSIEYILLNTNGVRIAKDAEFARELDRMYRRRKLQLYLQFDGVQEEGQKELRGGDLRATRQRAIEVCGAFAGGGLPITLAMTVTRSTIDHVWDAVEFGLHYPHVRGVAFQPYFMSGRAPMRNDDPLNTADVIHALISQSDGALTFDDFTPLPCGDPNCATIGYLLKTEDGLRSIGEFVDFSRLQGFLSDRLNYSLADLAQCGCESEPLGALLKQFELNESSTFRLFIKPFMDANTWDDDRIDRCCTHVIRPDGKLDSFCRYYSGLPGTWHGPRAAQRAMSMK
ncbi:MAG: radical SAM protein [Candidatus Hydrogenedentes bacterium]|nr:radical SAM protein [Candidatus Hydrogenedentota bacterium]